MNNLDLTLEIDRKKEYTKQVVNILNIRLYEGLQTIYNDAKKICKKKNTDNYLEQFQELLTTIPKWNKETVSKELLRIKIKSNCNWIEELITAVFVSHTKVLTAIKGTEIIDLKIPSAIKFIHKCYIECARVFWKNPYLFSDVSISPCEYQRNLRDCETVISKKIAETIRKMLPIELILKSYLGNVKQTNNDDSSIITIIKNEKDNIKKIIEKDLESSYQQYNSNSNSNSQEITDTTSVTVESLNSKEVQSITKKHTSVNINNSIELPKELQSTFINENKSMQTTRLNTPVIDTKEFELNTPLPPVIDNSPINLDTPVTTKTAIEHEPINKYSPGEFEEIHSQSMSNMDKLLQSKNTINNLDILTEHQDVNRVKKSKDTLEILKNSEKKRLQTRKKYNRYLFK
mgnify:CR=1 FL=1